MMIVDAVITPMRDWKITPKS